MVRFCSAAGFALLVSLASVGLAAEPKGLVKEDLSKCTLPHGEIVLLDRNDPDAGKGYILDISAGVLKPMPAAAVPPKSAAEYLGLIRDKDAGDLIFSRLEGGTLLSVSTRIADLGAGLLADFDGKEIKRPVPVESKEERDSQGRGTPAALDKVLPQHVYVVETADGKFALVRLIQIQENKAAVQYVYQPDGTRNFRVPKAPTIEVKAEVKSAAGTLKIGPAQMAQINDVGTLLQARQAMITKLLQTVKKPAGSAEERLGKAIAIRTLGTLRAEEAVETLLEEVAFVSEFEPSRETTFTNSFPAVAALVSIGKAGSLGAVERLAATRLRKEDQELQTKVRLLTEVVKGVEGVDVATFMLQRRLAAAAGQDHTGLQSAMESLSK